MDEKQLQIEKFQLKQYIRSCRKYPLKNRRYDRRNIRSAVSRVREIEMWLLII